MAAGTMKAMFEFNYLDGKDKCSVSEEVCIPLKNSTIQDTTAIIISKNNVPSYIEKGKL